MLASESESLSKPTIRMREIDSEWSNLAIALIVGELLRFGHYRNGVHEIC